MLPRHLVPAPPPSPVDEHDDGTASICRCRRQVQVEQVLTQVALPRLGRLSAKSLADLFHLFFGRFSRILQVPYDVESPFIGHCCTGFRLGRMPVSLPNATRHDCGCLTALRARQCGLVVSKRPAATPHSIMHIRHHNHRDVTPLLF